jgi:hypothetical protein
MRSSANDFAHAVSALEQHRAGIAPNVVLKDLILSNATPTLRLTTYTAACRCRVRGAHRGRA